MKKLLFFILLVPVFSFTQVHLGMGTGYDFASQKPLGTILLGAEIHKVVLDGVISPSLTRTAYVNNFFALKAGYNFHNFIGSVGFYNDYKSADNKAINHNYAGYSLTKVIPIYDDGRDMFINALYTKKGFQLTAGIYCSF